MKKILAVVAFSVLGLALIPGVGSSANASVKSDKDAAIRKCLKKRVKCNEAAASKPHLLREIRKCWNREQACRARARKAARKARRKAAKARWNAKVELAKMKKECKADCRDARRDSGKECRQSTKRNKYICDGLTAPKCVKARKKERLACQKDAKKTKNECIASCKKLRKSDL